MGTSPGRISRHVTERSTRTFLSEDERRQIHDAIQAAESRTSSEIRVHLERRAKGEPVAAAWREFDLLGMSQTADRNGVLFFLALRDRSFAIVGDIGLKGKVDDSFWAGLKDRLGKAFQGDRFGAGLAEAIRELGAKLATVFPHQAGQANRLPDDVSMGRDE